jgi:RHS repeat-associated protein
VAGSGTPTIFYEYDALGRRVAKTVNGTSTTYLLDGDDDVAEYSGASLLRRYINGSGVDDHLAHAEGSAVSAPPKTYYHVNGNNTVVAMTDSSGTMTQRFAYDEFGSTALGSDVNGEQFRYAGRRFDPETGLYYYRARYYSPTLGRFLQPDSVGYDDDLNLYAYVGNDPLDKTDPTGKCGMDQNSGDCEPAKEFFNKVSAWFFAKFDALVGNTSVSGGVKIKQTLVEEKDMGEKSKYQTAVEAKVGGQVDKNGVRVVGTLEVPTSVSAGKQGVEGSAGSASAKVSFGTDGFKSSMGDPSSDKGKVTSQMEATSGGKKYDLGVAKVSINSSGVVSVSVSRGYVWGQVDFDTQGYASDSRAVDQSTPSPYPAPPQ